MKTGDGILRPVKTTWLKDIDRVGLGVLLGALLLFLPFCGAYGMWDPWETHYGEAARQILERGDWWTLYWEDDYFFSKPILLFWLMALSFKVLGVTEVAARLPVALCAVAGVYAAYWGVRWVTRSRATGVLAAAAMASTPLYAFIGRQCITDMPFVASMVIALMALARFELTPEGRPRHIYMFYFFTGLATLAKGPLGLLLPGAVVLAYLVVSGRWGFLRRARIPSGVVVYLCVAAPWYATMFLMHGERFYNEFIVYNNVQRATGSGVHGSHIDFLYYVRQAAPGSAESGAPVLQVGAFPWLAVFPAALFTYVLARFGRLWPKRGARTDEPTGPGVQVEDPQVAEGRLQLALLLLLWAVVSFVTFSGIPTKFHHYLLPLAPPVGMVAALWLSDAARRRIGEPVVIAGSLLAAGIVVWLSLLIGRDPSEVINLFIYEYGRPDLRRFEVGGVYQWTGFAIAAALLLVAVVRRFRLHLAGAAAALSVGLAAYGIDVHLPLASDCVSQVDAFRHYDAARRPGDRLINWKMNYRGEVFYGRSEAVKAVSNTHLRWLLSRSDRSFIVANRGTFGTLATAMRRLTGQEPEILNPETCNTRMVLYDGPRIAPPRFEPPEGTLVDRVPESVTNRPENVRIGPDISLVGYQVEWIGSGSTLMADVTMYLRCDRETDEWWKVFLHGESAALPGRREIDDHTAVGDDYPSVAWRRGDIVVDRARLRVGWILDVLGGQGEIGISMGLFHDMTRAWVAPDDAHDGENRVLLARYDTHEVPEGAVLARLPGGVEPLGEPVRLADVATIVATEVSLRGEGRDALAEVVLYLRAEVRTTEPWQVFLHAEGAGDRRAVSDHHPASGRLPTTDWEPGRIVVDRTFLDLSRHTTGTVRVYGGMFSNEGRARIEPADADVGSHRVLLGELTLP
jgi:4-amino-4-deoxy-L-arabinose transferase-like glycosyltransferase